MREFPNHTQYISDKFKLYLDGNVEGWRVEGLEHDLSHLFTIGFGVERSLSQEYRVFLGGDTQFIVEGVMPDLLHIVPVGDNTVLDGIPQSEDTTLGLSLVTDVRVLLSHTDHHTLVARATNNGGEDLGKRDQAHVE